MSFDKSLFINDMSLKGENNSKTTNITEIKNELSNLNQRISNLSDELAELIRHRNELAAEITAQQEDNRLPPVTLEPAIIRQNDSATAKAEFMLELFDPRKDIYATRERNKGGKTVYYPRCRNLWKEGCYRKIPGIHNIPCSDCSLNEKARLSPEVIIQGNFLNTNENGKGAIGIYPLKQGNTTSFVAIDLDEDDWIEATKAILTTARQQGIAMAAERSFSGNGAHLWIFFSEAISASKARKLATLLIDKTREKDSSISIKSYDRLFPSQDTLTANGYGNLILLPLVASAVKRGCTLFLDDNLNPYPLKEQIPYLSSLHRHSLIEVQAFIDSMEDQEFQLMSPTEEQMNPSWSKWIPKIDKKDVLSKIVLYLSTGISLDKNALSVRAQEALRRIGTISNPIYYKELARRDGHYTGIDSRIPLYEENERVIKLPRGLYGTIAKLFESIDIPFEVEDHRTAGTGLKASLNKELRPYQEEAVAITRKTDLGIIAAATGSGKTLIALAIIAEKNERTLIIVSSKALIEQWRKAIEESLIIETTPEAVQSKRGRKPRSTIIGTLEGSRGNQLKGVIDIATIQCLSSHTDKDGKSIASRYGLIIVDECHHIAADKSREVLKHMSARYVYGLSATPKRADGLEQIVYSECGDVLFTYEASKLAYSRGIAQYFILRFLPTAIPDGNSRISFTETLNHIADDEDRNSSISADIKEAYTEGRHILILTRRVEQNNMIGKYLIKKDIPHIILSSSMKQKEINGILQKLRSSDEHTVLIATDKLLGEGVDIPNLDTLFLASPFMQESAIQQYAGRIAREAEGKKNTLIYDYVDFLLPRLSYMYLKRLSIYRKLGYVPLTDTDKPDAEMLFDDTTFTEPFINDIANASRMISISSSYITSSRITDRIINTLIKKATEGISVSMILSDRAKVSHAFQAIIHRIEESNISIKTSGPIRNQAIIDDLICWYGDFSLLGQSARTQKEQERKSMLRIINKDAARCFMADTAEHKLQI